MVAYRWFNDAEVFVGPLSDIGIEDDRTDLEYAHCLAEQLLELDEETRFVTDIYHTLFLAVFREPPAWWRVYKDQKHPNNPLKWEIEDDPESPILPGTVTVACSKSPCM